jgi:hypothetical protein
MLELTLNALISGENRMRIDRLALPPLTFGRQTEDAEMQMRGVR